MRISLLILSLLLAVPAFADVLRANIGAGRGKQAGAACTTRDGQRGTCKKVSVARFVYGSGIPPTTKRVKMLGCVARGGAPKARTPLLAELSLALLALVAALWMRAQPAPQPTS